MFKFGLGQRVNVPSYSGVQGVVQQRTDGLIEETKYVIAWLAGMQMNVLQFTEAEVVTANPPEPVVKAEVTAASSDDFGQTLKQAAKPNRKRPARKSAKPKRKR